MAAVCATSCEQLIWKLRPITKMDCVQICLFNLLYCWPKENCIKFVTNISQNKFACKSFLDFCELCCSPDLETVFAPASETVISKRVLRCHDSNCHVLCSASVTTVTSSPLPLLSQLWSLLVFVFCWILVSVSCSLLAVFFCNGLFSTMSRYLVVCQMRLDDGGYCDWVQQYGDSSKP